MKILVISDSHGDTTGVKEIILSVPRAEVVIHLGDAQADLDVIKSSFPEKAFYCVRGNCDLGSELPNTGTLSLEGKRIFFTHGHLYGVKYGLSQLMEAGADAKADIILYGHTHIADNRYEDGVYVMNPGSSRGWGASYGVIDIEKGNILTNIFNRK